MTDDEARDWLSSTYPRRMPLLERFAALLRAAAREQSLIAASTSDEIWTRHIADSAQLVGLANRGGTWHDIGSGAGLPGIVVAILRDKLVILSEPRRKRAQFLSDVVLELGLKNVSVRQSKAQHVTDAPAIVSARAVAPMTDIFAWTAPYVSRETLYLLPRGRSWQLELEITRRAWHATFHVKPSLTDPASGVVTAEAVHPR